MKNWWNMTWSQLSVEWKKKKVARYRWSFSGVLFLFLGYYWKSFIWDVKRMYCTVAERAQCAANRKVYIWQAGRMAVMAAVFSEIQNGCQAHRRGWDRSSEYIDLRDGKRGRKYLQIVRFQWKSERRRFRDSFEEIGWLFCAADQHYRREGAVSSANPKNRGKGWHLFVHCTSCQKTVTSVLTEMRTSETDLLKELETGICQKDYN